ncbi:GIY-YIG nuclease family protein [Rhizobium leucaenae]|uniref:GIY-YIG nuclease family protein n=1 Tax=Rhizobium leucaenae TaxID=29450 RepID=UPI0004248559|nr:GIY-YIG nuclease family protein [Rhizobium leucaenae]
MARHADNDNEIQQRYETGAGNVEWVVPAFVDMSKAEVAALSKPLVEFYDMVVEATEVVNVCKTPKVQCAVYVISDIYGREVKIGKAANPPYRLAQLQTGNPRKLFIHRVFWMSQADADEAEKNAHTVAERLYSRLEGEWFQCSPSDAHTAIEGSLFYSHTRYCAMTPLSELWRAA